jgi:methylated-DNA-[protein]-cysteine S-methyltransferase
MSAFPDWLDRDPSITVAASTYVESPLGSLLLLCSAEGLLWCHFVEDSAAVGRFMERHRLAPRPPSSEEHPLLQQGHAWLQAYFQGPAGTLHHLPPPPPFDLRGTDFQREVWRAVAQVPVGQTLAYGDLSRSFGRAAGSAALAQALGSCPLIVLVPVHRVVPDGTQWPQDRVRAWLLRHERRRPTFPLRSRSRPPAERGCALV